MKKFLGNDSFLKVFSFVIAIIIWFYIIIIVDPPVVYVVRDIPIRYVQQNNLNSMGLSIVNESVSKIDLKIKGSRKKIVNLDSKNVLATVDLSSVTKAGKHTLPINLTIPYDYNEILNDEPYSIDLVIDKIVEEKRNINVRTVGNPETGYIAGKPEINPQTILLRGAASYVSSVADVRVTVDINGKNKDVSDHFKIELIDSSGNIIDAKDSEIGFVSSDITKAEVMCPILRLKTVSIRPSFNGNLPNGKTVTIQPNALTIYGYEDVIENITEITTEPISVNSLLGGTIQSVGLNLPENINLRDSVTTVTVKLSNNE